MSESIYVEYYVAAKILLDAQFDLEEKHSEDCNKYRPKLPTFKDALESLFFVAIGGRNSFGAINSESIFSVFLENYIQKNSNFDEESITNYLWVLTYSIYGKISHETGQKPFDPELVSYLLVAFNSRIDSLPSNFDFNEEFWTDFILKVKMTVMQNSLPVKEAAPKVAKI